MKRFITVVFCICLIVGLLTTMTCKSEAAQNEQSYGITMPDGSFIPLEGLSELDQKEVISMMNKVAYTQTKKAATATAEKLADSNIGQDALKTVGDTLTDPAKLDSWRKLITNTIKDICNDLNVSVNEFVKTPAGLGVSALIIYKVAGEEIFANIAETLFDVLFAIPMWFTIMALVLYFNRKYFGFVTVYEEKAVEEQAGKGNKDIVTYSKPNRVPQYTWKSDDAKTGFAWALILTSVIITAVTILIIFI